MGMTNVRLVMAMKRRASEVDSLRSRLATSQTRSRRGRRTPVNSSRPSRALIRRSRGCGPREPAGPGHHLQVDVLQAGDQGLDVARLQSQLGLELRQAPLS